ncbi:MAG: nucleotidyltransferase domain-containing protein [Pyrobaculum sp.]
MCKAKSALRSQPEAVRRACAFLEKARLLAKKAGVEVEGAYLVGSRARGDYLEDSDVDVVLIVRGVEGLDALRRMELFTEALEPGVEFFVYTPEEWAGGGLWMAQLRREAVPLHCASLQ